MKPPADKEPMGDKNAAFNNKISAHRRREAITASLTQATEAVSASAFAERLQVSRQVIVGDIAILRAQGLDILSTPKGYFMGFQVSNPGKTFTIACQHDQVLAREELYTIVDQGGKLLDVMVEHPVYGQLVGQLAIASRYDADAFLAKIQAENTHLLSHLTGGVHVHTIACSSQEAMERILAGLRGLHILLDEDV